MATTPSRPPGRPRNVRRQLAAPLRDGTEACAGELLRQARLGDTQAAEAVIRLALELAKEAEKIEARS